MKRRTKKTVTKPEELSVDGALESLVHQFADPLSFYRELIQNALDAGSREIDVRIVYEKSSGAAIVHVDDFGEGMNREIIETRLTRLFDSSKDGDLTKIGRFGIGFVSVFAIEPEAVVIDTSRDGQNWRLVFKQDKSYRLIARDTAVEGTKIRIFKAMPKKEFQNLRKRSLEVIRYWCKHVDAEVRVDGELVSGPVTLDAALSVRAEEQGTMAIVGIRKDLEPHFGFYNKGLTLLEGKDKFFQHVAFKVSSRYLEHTLARDNVIQDENFHKAMRLVRRLALMELPELLLSRIDAALESRASREDLEFLYTAMGRFQFGSSRKGADQDEALFATASHKLFRAVNGDLLTHSDVMRAHGRDRLLTTPRPNPLSERLHSNGHLVVLAASRSGARTLLNRLLGSKVSPAVSEYAYPVPVDPEAKSGERFRALRNALTRLLTAYGAKWRSVELAHFCYSGSGICSRLAISQRTFGEITRRDQLHELGSSFFSRKRVLVINVDHSTVRRLARLAKNEPELAAYILVKQFFLRGTLTTRIDSRLCAHAIEDRCRRLAS